MTEGCCYKLLVSIFRVFLPGVFTGTCERLVSDPVALFFLLFIAAFVFSSVFLLWQPFLSFPRLPRLTPNSVLLGISIGLVLWQKLQRGDPQVIATLIAPGKALRIKLPFGKQLLIYWYFSGCYHQTVHLNK